MVFLVGARQVGKTTLGLSSKELTDNFVYLNWDFDTDRKLILEGPSAINATHSLDKLQVRKSIIVFDEIHKFHNWRNFLKGFYDKYQERAQFIITGSAKLDSFRTGGDSLMGRYFPYRIHPLSIAELVNQDLRNATIGPPKKIGSKELEHLTKFGGFPEPFYNGSESFFRRWSRLRFDQLFLEDIRELSRVNELTQLRTLTTILTQNASELFNFSNVAKMIGVSQESITSWVNILSNFYFCFLIRPWTNNVKRSLLKQPKIYLNDWSMINDPGKKIENLVACHLQKAVHFWTDTGLGDFGLYYVRDKDQREVDFLVTKDNQPWFLVEVKSGNNNSLSKSLYYFHDLLKTQHAFQISYKEDYIDKDCFKETMPIIVPLSTFLSQLI